MIPERLGATLSRLLPHLDSGRIALTGGVAVGLHLGARCGERARGLAADDVDLVASGVDAVHPGVTAGFLVSHFHLPHPGYAKFLVQLADPVTRLRVDLFPDSLHALARAAVMDVAGVPLRVLAPDDILEHKLATLAKASAAHPAEPKHFEDARRLAALCGRPVPPVPAAHLGAATYSRDVDAVCARCEASRCAAFPLAPRREILDVLGYV
ncbi:MAG TPA: hypothetical protein VFJ82_22250 [Longimicrobium sp.]|nr:hypothetical protein [Longimicrobium sp.]